MDFKLLVRVGKDIGPGNHHMAHHLVRYLVVFDR